jgi:endonuclease/exonuclease/phosphatase family metal-dependent hydrolase
MLTCLFWNLNRKPLVDKAALLCKERDVDILLLAEQEVSQRKTVEILKRENLKFEQIRPPSKLPSPRVEVWSRIPTANWTGAFDSESAVIFNLRTPAGSNLLLVGAHLNSKLYAGPEDQQIACMRLAGEIARAEANFGHTRTVLVGDLNMDPFEPGIVMADGLHSISSRIEAQRESRRVSGVLRPFFYNPMWSRFGDKNWCPPGTYFYHSSNQLAYFWHLFDQVMVRPSLLSRFPENEIDIVTQFDNTSLLDINGRPDRKLGSDHLPLQFKLDV